MNDLLSLALLLRPLQQASPERPFPRWWGRAAHHLLLQTLKLADEELSAELHEGAELRPFTASTLYGRFPEHQLDLQGSYLLRFTGLNQFVSDALRQAIAEGGNLSKGAILNLDFIDFEVQAVHHESGTHPLAERTSYHELATASLLDAEPAARRVSFFFASSTAFHRHGKQVPYPLPELVIGSLLDRWNAFAPIAFPAEARRYAAECLTLGHFEIKNRTVNVAGGVQNGLVGHVNFNTTSYDRYWMSLMQTLARFSYYSGVGVKTAMGMGQCRKVVEREKKANN